MKNIFFIEARKLFKKKKIYTVTWGDFECTYCIETSLGRRPSGVIGQVICNLQSVDDVLVAIFVVALSSLLSLY